MSFIINHYGPPNFFFGPLLKSLPITGVGKHLSDMFPIKNGLKQGNAFSPPLFNFVLEFAIRRVQINQDGVKLNGKHQLWLYADDVNILGGSVHTIKKNTEAVLVACTEIGLEVNVIKLSTCSCLEHNAGRRHSIKIDNSSFERVEEFKYLGINLTNRTSMQ